MDSITQVNNLAQFARLVGAARSRNNGLIAGTLGTRAAFQTTKPRSFSGAAPVTTYSNTRQPAKVNTVESNEKPQQTRNLGTKFDAYA
jgi:hypothetical protein